MIIEKGVEIPSRSGGRGRPAKYPFLQMEVGDSFAVDGVTQQHMSSVATMHSRRHGGRFCTRKQEDGSVRIWRTA